MKVGVIGGVRSVTHSVSWVVWACHPLTSCMAYAPPTRALPLGLTMSHIFFAGHGGHPPLGRGQGKNPLRSPFTKGGEKIDAQARYPPCLLKGEKR